MVGSREKIMSSGHDLEGSALRLGLSRAWSPGAGGRDAVLRFHGM